jgi:flagellin-specific chaperone FliS
MAKTADYLLKISNASPVDLVIINYDILIDDINEAVRNHGLNPDIYISGINGARDALVELIGALDATSPIYKDLYPVYEYVNTLLMGALIYEKKANLEEALQLLGLLRDGWIKARDSEPDGTAVYKNKPKVYSGLTYGKKGPEDFEDINPDGGIKV